MRTTERTLHFMNATLLWRRTFQDGFHIRHFIRHTQYLPLNVTDTKLFEMIVGVLTTCHPVLQMQPHVLSFYGVTSIIRFMFLLFPQVSRNWRYESEHPLKQSPLTSYKQFGTNTLIVLMFVESQRVHIWSTCKVCNKNLEWCSIKQKIHILLSQVYCVWQIVKTPTIISNNPVFQMSVTFSMVMHFVTTNLDLILKALDDDVRLTDILSYLLGEGGEFVRLLTFFKKTCHFWNRLCFRLKTKQYLFFIIIIIL